MNDPHPGAVEAAARLLDAHPGFRVLRAVPPLDRLVLPEAAGELRTIVVVDVETTTLDPASGRIIELALCPVQIDRRGRIVAVGEAYDWLEDPGEPLSPLIAGLTGLSDADLAGRRIDDRAALAMLDRASVLVSHNARFDAGWIEARYPSLAGKRWACSLLDVDWRGHGYDSRQLGGLLTEAAGLFNTRHRADTDVAALVALLAHPLPNGGTVCAEMMRTASRSSVRLAADRAPFAVKGLLKARGYRWNPDRRHWWIEVASVAADAERAWLAERACCRNPSARTITWHERHRC